MPLGFIVTDSHMLFNSFIFLLFLVVVVPLVYATPKRFRIPLVLGISYFFYGYWDWRFCFLLLGSTAIAYILGRLIHQAPDQQKKKRLMVLGLVLNLTILGFFKYFNFFVDSFHSVAELFGGRLDFLHMHIILPVGISFYTFQTMSYLIDVYRGTMEPSKRPLDFALYVSFFPQLVAGPIERADRLLPQFKKGLIPSRAQMREGVNLIIIGMFQKVLLGDASGRIVDHVFANPEYYASIELLMGLLLFSVQIYADFAGYSNIARGTGKLLGVELMVNFRQPYLSRSIAEFWGRWHISLSQWLRDYIYIPLGGNRKGKIRTYINLFMTMLLAGLWHGAAWTFVVYGMLHGIYLTINRIMLKGGKIRGPYKYDNPIGLIRFISSIVGTYFLLVASRLLFRSDDFSVVGLFLKKMIYWEASPLAGRMITIALSFSLLMTIMDVIVYRTRRDDFTLLIRSLPARWGVLSALFMITLLYMFVEEPLPFVYFQF